MTNHQLPLLLPIVSVVTSLLIVVPPLMAFFYTLCVWMTYAINHEITWSSKLPALFRRFVVVVVATCITAGLVFGYDSIIQSYNGGDDESNTTTTPTPDDDNASWLAILLPILTFMTSAVSIITSIKFCKDTRQNDVVGLPSPDHQIPFYGPSALQNKVVVVTGANSGVGKETVRQCASMGATVILLCRSQSKAQDAIEEILHDSSLSSVDGSSGSSSNSNNGTITKEQLIFVPMDLSHFDSIHQAVDKIKELLLGLSKKNKTTENNKNSNKAKKVDVLINNAGLMMGTQTFSKHDNLEMMMQANHLGHYLLTRLLIDQQLLSGMEDDDDDGDGDDGKNNSTNTGPGRIINLTSSTYEFSSEGFDFEDMFCTRGKRKYTLFGQYSMTKLANILMVKGLLRKYPNHNLLVYAVHPGIVRTNVTSNMQWYWQLPNWIFAVIVRTLQKTPSEGAYSTVFCATHPPCPQDLDGDNNKHQLPPNGSYIVNCQSQPLLECANSIDDADKLWDVSEHLVGLSSCTRSSNDSSKTMTVRRQVTVTTGGSSSTSSRMSTGEKSSSSLLEEKKSN